MFFDVLPIGKFTSYSSNDLRHLSRKSDNTSRQLHRRDRAMTIGVWLLALVVAYGWVSFSVILVLLTARGVLGSC